MKPSILTFRLNRRAIGVAALDGESLRLADGRHLTSRRDKTVLAAHRFIYRLLVDTAPSLVVVDAPSAADGAVSSAILDDIRRTVTDLGIDLLAVTKSELLTAYGLYPVKSRRDLREIVRSFWPELSNVRGKVEPYAVDATAAALYADCRLQLERVVT
jgi:hypothetical protein